MRELVFDAWTPMNFKRVMGNRTQGGVGWEMPVWTGQHKRRLTAYKVLQAYLDNSAREFIATTDEDKIEAHREYGDAALIRDTILAAILGNDQEVVVPGAAEPEVDGEGASDDDARDPDADAKWDLQDWLRTQWDLERGPLKLQETERDTVGLGDGVYTIGWSSKKGRARIRVWDPGMYFPVLTDGNEDDYPDKVHIAWEVPEEDRRDKNKLEIRRLTWELVPVEPWTPAYQAEASEWTCLYTDALFIVDRGRGRPTVLDLDESSAVFQLDEDGEPIDQVDLEIDFLPVLHLPNTVAIKNHYGTSSIATVLQILDDLANSDTDAQAASATAAKPVMALEGGSLGKKAPSYNAGEVWELGEGRLNVVDTSRSLDAILKYVEHLLSRLSVNARTPDSLLGRVKPSEVPSGLALALSFGPLATMVGSMRLSRAEKYPLLLKFVWRMNVVGQASDTPATWFPADLQLGSFLPSDRGAIVTEVGVAYVAGVISRHTAVQMLMAAGLPIEDAEQEVTRIEHEDFPGAGELRAALDSDELVLDYLGLDRPEDLVEKPDPPEILPPPPGGGPPVPPDPDNPVPPAPAPPQV